MSAATIETDYLVIGTGATAMAFVDTLLTEQADATVLMVDRHHRPGGHWNDFSAPLIAYVESHVFDQDEQNALCSVVPSPEKPIDWLRMWAVNLRNTARWRQHSGLSAWLMQCRLNGFAVYLHGVKPDDPTRAALLQELGVQSAAAATKLPALLASAV